MPPQPHGQSSSGLRGSGEGRASPGLPSPSSGTEPLAASGEWKRAGTRGKGVGAAGQCCHGSSRRSRASGGTSDLFIPPAPAL